MERIKIFKSSGESGRKSWTCEDGVEEPLHTRAALSHSWNETWDSQSQLFEPWPGLISLCEAKCLLSLDFLLAPVAERVLCVVTWPYSGHLEVRVQLHNSENSSKLGITFGCPTWMYNRHVKCKSYKIQCAGVKMSVEFELVPVYPL